MLEAKYAEWVEGAVASVWTKWVVFERGRALAKPKSGVGGWIGGGSEGSKENKQNVHLSTCKRDSCTSERQWSGLVGGGNEHLVCES